MTESLKMMAGGFSRISLTIYQSIYNHIPEGCLLHYYKTSYCLHLLLIEECCHVWCDTTQCGTFV